uniref:Protein-serine/threonine kinase n=2 Tax=Chlamydomonas incerta TaxID=51695 RepID=Q5U7L9_CHLIN|nr:pyruvate dehydrogenase kinase-like protein [Chlamydomonas incerta]
MQFIVQRIIRGLGSTVDGSGAWRGARALHAGSAARCAEFQLNTVRAESFYDSTVEKYAAQDVEVLSLRQMLSFGRNAWNDPDKVLKSARYVQRELPKRLARRLLDLQLLPYIVVTNPHIKKVYNQYYVSFETLRRVPTIKTLEDNQDFCQLLRQHLDSHAPMLDSLATGLRECKSKELVGSCLHMDSFFDSMLRSRISRRVIAEQHLHINNKRPAFIGIICTDLDVHDSIDFAVQKTKQVCMETYGTAPDVVVSGDPHVTIPYIPAHLDYMLYELLKNAMRAVVEQGRAQQAARQAQAGGAGNPAFSCPPPKLPPVHVRVCPGVNGTLTIRISDQGGGVAEELIDKVWSYGFTTIGRNAQAPSGGSSSSSSSSNGAGKDGMGPDVVEGLGSGMVQQMAAGAGASGSAAAATSTGRGGSGGRRQQPGGGLQVLMRGPGGHSRYQMAGLGFGLPLSRLYARYFGGDLRLQTIPGYGVDAYLTLRRLEEHEWEEHVDEPGTLPINMAPY